MKTLLLCDFSVLPLFSLSVCVSLCHSKWFSSCAAHCGFIFLVWLSLLMLQRGQWLLQLWDKKSPQTWSRKKEMRHRSQMSCYRQKVHEEIKDGTRSDGPLHRDYWVTKLFHQHFGCFCKENSLKSKKDSIKKCNQTFKWKRKKSHWAILSSPVTVCCKEISSILSETSKSLYKAEPNCSNSGGLLFQSNRMLLFPVGRYCIEVICDGSWQDVDI